MLDFDLERLSIPGLTVTGGNVTLPLWMAGAALALLLLLFVLTLLRRGFGAFALVALVALGAGAAYLFFERDRLDERRAIETRLGALQALALAPGSPLACLEGVAGEAVESACEKVVFASPDTVAATTGYTAAKLTMLADGMNFASRRDPEFARTLDRLRRSIEHDRFGIVANVLMIDNGCTADRCDALVLLRDPTRVRNNMRERSFDAIVARNRPNWEERPAGTTATPMSGAAAPLPSELQSPAPAASSEPQPAPAATPPAPPPPPAAAPVRRPAPSPAPRPPAQARPQGGPPPPTSINPPRPQ